MSAAVVAALPPAVGSISGTVFHDDNGDGKAGPGEAPIGGRRVYIDVNLNQAYDPETEAVSSAVTDAAGLYTIPLRTYATQVFRQVVPLGSESTGISAFYYTGGGNYTAPDFTSRESTAVGDVTVAAWQDATGNGRREAADGPLGGLGLYLDYNNNGRRDGGEPVATTAADTGAATFVGVPAGDHVVRATVPVDYAQTTPTQGAGLGARVFGGKVADAGSFGLAPASLFGRVSGFVFDDANADGVLQAGEQALLQGRTVYADYNNNATPDSGEPFMTTVVDGYWLSLPAGTYTLRQISPDGWRQTSPAGGAGATVTVQAGLRYRQDFGTLPVVTAPTADPGGPYTVNEGTALTLTAQPSPTGQGPFTYEWDFAYDGQTFRPSATGAGVAFPSDIINGPTTRTIALRVRDAGGAFGDVATTTVTVNNVAPTATFAATPPSVKAGQPSKLVFTNPKDPDPSDVAAGFRYSYDLDGDHIYDIVDTPNSAVTVPGDNLRFTGPILLFGRITDKDGGSTEYVTSIQVAPDLGDDTQSPFSGTALPLAADGTTTVQVENFDNGPEGIAYHDTDAANLGTNTYRGTTGVDLESITDGGPGVGLGYVKAGEWLEYALVVMSRGTYDVGFRVASLKAGGSFHLEVDGAKVGSSISVPDTGAWTTWRTVTLNGVQLPEGTHTFRLAFDTNGAIGYVGNFNHMTFAKSTVTPPPPPPPPPGYTGTPFSGTPIAIPAAGTSTVQVEDFDNGGEGVAYHDTDAANVGGNTAYRPGGVDLATTTDGSSATILSFAKAGEWLKYSVDVAEAGAYNVGFRVSSLKTGGAIHLEVDGVKVGGAITVPDTGAWTAWRTITLDDVPLPAGRHVLALKFDTQSSIGYVGNFNYMTFTKSTVTPPPPGYTGTPFGGTAAKVNATGSSTVEMENFDDGGEGVAYHDLDSANLGKTTYRTGGVDVEAINDAGAAGFGIGFARAGEWLKYTVDVAADGTYDLDVRLASLSGGGAFHLELDGVRLTPNLAVPKTGAWTTYGNVRQTGVALMAGRHLVRLVMDANGSTGYVANFNWMRFTRH